MIRTFKKYTNHIYRLNTFMHRVVPVPEFSVSESYQKRGKYCSP